METEREHRKNIYHPSIGKTFIQRSAFHMIDNKNVETTEIEQLSYQDLKGLDDEKFKIALDYLLNKYGNYKKISQKLNVCMSTFHGYVTKNRGYKPTDVPTYCPIKAKNKVLPTKIKQEEKSNAAHISKIEYEIVNTTALDIKTVVNLFLNQVDETKKYNLFFSFSAIF